MPHLGRRRFSASLQAPSGWPVSMAPFQTGGHGNDPGTIRMAHVRPDHHADHSENETEKHIVKVPAITSKYWKKMLFYGIILVINLTGGIP